MQAEIYIQDNFYSEQTSLPNLEFGDRSNRITSQTWESWFRGWLNVLQPDIPKVPSYEIGLRLTDDTEIQKLNYEYRQLDRPTDVLAFASLDTDIPQSVQIPEEIPLYLGDIVISVVTASKQAKQQDHSLKTELAWLASHGLLHLLGWDHPDEESLIEMLNQQVILLKTVNISISV
ncbi:rRNA maturation RNase YbeY [Mastigocoleus testarum]|uniref:Endoribonuclease YbeY n=1 Tax=Mastigocoleus testarum BC008 TaxID=371196 RepID=A0A0V7ZRM4_9CYAN|nr:rRNA maturation RNase YbeY [Mastigocoleus testarum]KST67267.1 rRNA maturation RNase YbeY [Mastigocoleus testarum BC008]